MLPETQPRRRSSGLDSSLASRAIITKHLAHLYTDESGPVAEKRNALLPWNAGGLNVKLLAKLEKCRQ